MESVAGNAFSMSFSAKAANSGFIIGVKSAEKTVYGNYQEKEYCC